MHYRKGFYDHRKLWEIKTQSSIRLTLAEEQPVNGVKFDQISIWFFKRMVWLFWLLKKMWSGRSNAMEFWNSAEPTASAAFQCLPELHWIRYGYVIGAHLISFLLQTWGNPGPWNSRPTCAIEWENWIINTYVSSLATTRQYDTASPEVACVRNSQKNDDDFRPPMSLDRSYCLCFTRQKPQIALYQAVVGGCLMVWTSLPCSRLCFDGGQYF